MYQGPNRVPVILALDFSGFAFLKYSGCVPEDNVFHQLVLSLTISLYFQAKAPFSAASFLKQKRRETLVSHLHGSIHASVKHSLLMTPSSSSLFAEDVIKDSGEGRFPADFAEESSRRSSEQTASSASTSS